MRVLVTGDRAWDCRDLAVSVVERLIARYGRDLTLVHGGCRGVDAAFAAAAADAGLTVEAHPADWANGGRRAGPERNARMVASGVDLCVAVHRFLANSKGTKDCARRAVAAGVPTYLVDRGDGHTVALRADDVRLK